MAKEMLIQILCDNHLRRLHERVSVDSEPPPITLGGITRVLTLCPACQALELTLDQWAQMLRECGTPVGQPAKPPSAAARRALATDGVALPVAEQRDESSHVLPAGVSPEGVARLAEHECPFDDCPRAHDRYEQKSSLGWHLKTSHGVRMSDITGRLRRRETPKPCTWPGCDEVMPTGSGLAVHLKKHEREQQMAS